MLFLLPDDVSAITLSLLVPTDIVQYMLSCKEAQCSLQVPIIRHAILTDVLHCQAVYGQSLSDDTTMFERLSRTLRTSTRLFGDMQLPATYWRLLTNWLFSENVEQQGRLQLLKSPADDCLWMKLSRIFNTFGYFFFDGLVPMQSKARPRNRGVKLLSTRVKWFASEHDPRRNPVLVGFYTGDCELFAGMGPHPKFILDTTTTPGESMDIQRLIHAPVVRFDPYCRDSALNSKGVLLYRNLDEYLLSLEKTRPLGQKKLMDSTYHLRLPEFESLCERREVYGIFLWRMVVDERADLSFRVLDAVADRTINRTITSFQGDDGTAIMGFQGSVVDDLGEGESKGDGEEKEQIYGVRQCWSMYSKPLVIVRRGRPAVPRTRRWKFKRINIIQHSTYITTSC